MRWAGLRVEILSSISFDSLSRATNSAAALAIAVSCAAFWSIDSLRRRLAGNCDGGVSFSLCRIKGGSGFSTPSCCAITRSRELSAMCSGWLGWIPKARISALTNAPRRPCADPVASTNALPEPAATVEPRFLATSWYCIIFRCSSTSSARREAWIALRRRLHISCTYLAALSIPLSSW
eukprot:7379628-Prymnesium_polylepis.3